MHQHTFPRNWTPLLPILKRRIARATATNGECGSHQSDNSIHYCPSHRYPTIFPCGLLELRLTTSRIAKSATPARHKLQRKPNFDADFCALVSAAHQAQLFLNRRPVPQVTITVPHPSSHQPQAPRRPIACSRNMPTQVLSFLEYPRVEPLSVVDNGVHGDF
jgi:hypothetical protein